MDQNTFENENMDMDTDIESADFGEFSGFSDYDEYGDPDATDCANGDYNTWEENQIFGEEY
jgi:hypothetical protein